MSRIYDVTFASLLARLNSEKEMRGLYIIFKNASVTLQTLVCCADKMRAFNIRYAKITMPALYKPKRSEILGLLAAKVMVLFTFLL